MHHFQNVLQAASDMKKKNPTSYIQSGMMTQLQEFVMEIPNVAVYNRCMFLGRL